MMELTINIPGLKELAEAVKVMTEAQQVAVAVTQPQPAAQAPVPLTAPVLQRGMQPETVQPDTTATQTKQQPAPMQPGEVPVYTLVDIRGVLSTLTKAGKKTQVQELIKSFGVDKLSQIPEERYPEVMQKAGDL